MFQKERAVAETDGNDSERLKAISGEPIGHNYTAEARGVESRPTLDAFLAAFYPDRDEELRLRAFKAKNASDTPDNRVEKLCITRAQLANDIQLRQRLKALNWTRGLYFVVNAGGDDDASITRFNACFVERDDVSVAEQHRTFDLAPLTPSIRVETRKSVHAYWLLTGDCDAGTWCEIQRRLIAFFHGDKANKNPSRVMRLPYFDHVSFNQTSGNTERKSVGLTAFDLSRRYTSEELLGAFPPVMGPQATITAEKGNQGRISEGERNVMLTSIAGKLRHVGLDEEEMFAALSAYNNKHCEPPLSPDEVKSVARSVSKYKPGKGELVYTTNSQATPAPTQKSDERPLSIVRMADVKSETVSWLWYPYIPLGKFTIMEGDPGLGKSWLTCALACAVSQGKGLPRAEPFEPGNVLMMSVEDGLGDTIRPRLDTIGANVERVFAVNEPLTLDTAGLIRLEAAIIEHEPLLIMIDPLFAFTGGTMDINRANEARAISAPLGGIAERHGCAIVAIRHLGKSRGGGHALNAGIGSIDFTAAARSVLLVGRDPDDETKRALAQTKNNLAPHGVAIGFKIEDGRFFWTGESDLTAARMLATDSAAEGRSSISEAIDFLREALAEGPQAAETIKSAARQAGISEATLRRAKGRLGVRINKQGQPGTDRQRWVWKLSGEGGQPRSEDDQKQTNEHLRASELTKDSYLSKLPEGVQFDNAEQLRVLTDEEAEAEAMRDLYYQSTDENTESI